jgi:hypothetical protein
VQNSRVQEGSNYGGSPTSRRRSYAREIAALRSASYTSELALWKTGSLETDSAAESHTSEFQQHDGGFASIALEEGVLVTGASRLYVCVDHNHNA